MEKVLVKKARRARRLVFIPLRLLHAVLCRLCRVRSGLPVVSVEALPAGKAKPRQNKKRKGGPIHNDVLKELRRPVMRRLTFWKGLRWETSGVRFGRKDAKCFLFLLTVIEW